MLHSLISTSKSW